MAKQTGGIQDNGFHNILNSSTTVLVDPVAFAEGWKQKVQEKEGIPVEQQRLTFPWRSGEGFGGQSPPCARWEGEDELLQDLRSWQAILRTDEHAIAKLHHPRVVPEKEQTDVRIRCDRAHQLRGIGVPCNVYYLAYDRWTAKWHFALPEGRKGTDPADVASSTGKLHIPIDSKFRGEEYHIDLYGRINGCNLPLPFEFKMSGREVCTQLSAQHQMVEYRKGHQTRHCSSSANNSEASCPSLLDGFLPPVAPAGSPKGLSPLARPDDICIPCNKGLNFTAVINSEEAQSQLRCVVLTVITVPSEVQASVPRRLSWLPPSASTSALCQTTHPSLSTLRKRHVKSSAGSSKGVGRDDASSESGRAQQVAPVSSTSCSAVGAVPASEARTSEGAGVSGGDDSLPRSESPLLTKPAGAGVETCSSSRGTVGGIGVARNAVNVPTHGGGDSELLPLESHRPSGTAAAAEIILSTGVDLVSTEQGAGVFNGSSLDTSLSQTTAGNGAAVGGDVETAGGCKKGKKKKKNKKKNKKGKVQEASEAAQMPQAADDCTTQSDVAPVAKEACVTLTKDAGAGGDDSEDDGSRKDVGAAKGAGREVSGVPLREGDACPGLDGVEASSTPDIALQMDRAETDATGSGKSRTQAALPLDFRIPLGEGHVEILTGHRLRPEGCVQSEEESPDPIMRLASDGVVALGGEGKAWCSEPGGRPAAQEAEQDVLNVFASGESETRDGELQEGRKAWAGERNGDIGDNCHNYGSTCNGTGQAGGPSDKYAGGGKGGGGGDRKQAGGAGGDEGAEGGGSHNGATGGGGAGGGGGMGSSGGGGGGGDKGDPGRGNKKVGGGSDCTSCSSDDDVSGVSCEGEGDGSERSEEARHSDAASDGSGVGRTDARGAPTRRKHGTGGGHELRTVLGRRTMRQSRESGPFGIRAGSAHMPFSRAGSSPDSEHRSRGGHRQGPGSENGDMGAPMDMSLAYQRGGIGGLMNRANMFGSFSPHSAPTQPIAPFWSHPAFEEEADWGSDAWARRRGMPSAKMPRTADLAYQWTPASALDAAPSAQQQGPYPFMPGPEGVAGYGGLAGLNPLLPGAGVQPGVLERHLAARLATLRQQQYWENGDRQPQQPLGFPGAFDANQMRLVRAAAQASTHMRSASEPSSPYGWGERVWESVEAALQHQRQQQPHPLVAAAAAAGGSGHLPLHFFPGGQAQQQLSLLNMSSAAQAHMLDRRGLNGIVCDPMPGVGAGGAAASQPSTSAEDDGKANGGHGVSRGRGSQQDRERGERAGDSHQHHGGLLVDHSGHHRLHHPLAPPPFHGRPEGNHKTSAAFKRGQQGQQQQHQGQQGQLAGLQPPTSSNSGMVSNAVLSFNPSPASSTISSRSNTGGAEEGGEAGSSGLDADSLSPKSSGSGSSSVGGGSGNSSSNRRGSSKAPSVVIPQPAPHHHHHPPHNIQRPAPPNHSNHPQAPPPPGAGGHAPGGGHYDGQEHGHAVYKASVGQPNGHMPSLALPGGGGHHHRHPGGAAAGHHQAAAPPGSSYREHAGKPEQGFARHHPSERQQQQPRHGGGGGGGGGGGREGHMQPSGGKPMMHAPPPPPPASNRHEASHQAPPHQMQPGTAPAGRPRRYGASTHQANSGRDAQRGAPGAGSRAGRDAPPERPLEAAPPGGGAPADAAAVASVRAKQLQRQRVEASRKAAAILDSVRAAAEASEHCLAADLEHLLTAAVPCVTTPGAAHASAAVADATLTSSKSSCLPSGEKASEHGTDGAASAALASLMQSCSLKDIWQWYEEPSAYGLGVKTTDTRREGQEALAFFVPYLSAVQLFRRAPAPIKAASEHAGGAPSSSSLSCIDEQLGPLPSHKHDATSEQRGSKEKVPGSRPGDGGSAAPPAAGGAAHVAAEAEAEGEAQEGVELLYEFFELDPPQLRMPLLPRVQALVEGGPGGVASSHGDPAVLLDIKLNELHPASWFSVAWYPIYRISEGPLRAVFITFHALCHVAQEDAPPAPLPSPSGQRSCCSLPVAGLQTCNAQAEHWFDVRPGGAARKDARATNRETMKKQIRQRIAALQSSASAMARVPMGGGAPHASLGPNFVIHNDYEFFVNRKP